MANKKLKDQRRAEREERRKRKKLQELGGNPDLPEVDDEDMALKIAIEERKLLVAQRKLESIRLLDELLERVKVNDVPTTGSDPSSEIALPG